MALPSARRPVMVEEELIEVREHQLREQLKVKLPCTTYEIFQHMMGDWYNNQLSKMERSKLTLKRFKRAVFVKLYQIKYEYNRLPKDWIQSLVEKYDIKLYHKKKRFVEKKSFADREKKTLLKAGPCQLKIKLTKTKDQSDDWDSLLTLDEASSSKAEAMNESDKAETEGLAKQPKRIIDLTNEPPPDFWLKAYADGIHLPRFLNFASMDDVNVIFYDYNPKFKELDLKKNTQQIHDGNGFTWVGTKPQELAGQNDTFELTE